LNALKIVVFAPLPKASATTATAVNPECFHNIHSA
jgi:hypothetical protein